MQNIKESNRPKHLGSSSGYIFRFISNAHVRIQTNYQDRFKNTADSPHFLWVVGESEQVPRRAAVRGYFPPKFLSTVAICLNLEAYRN